MTDTSAADLTNDDLNLVASLADATKDEEEIWNELEAEDEGRSNDDKEAVKAVEDDEEVIVDSQGAAGDSGAKPEAASEQDEGEGEGEGEGDEAPSSDEGEESNEGDEEGGPEEDIWTDAPEHLRNAHKALQDERDRFEHTIRSNHGRVSALQKQVTALRATLEKITTPADADPQAAVKAVSALADDYPEIAGPLKDALGTLQAQIDTVKTSEDRRQKASATDLAAHVEVETAALEAEHPGYEQFIGDNEAVFIAWLNTQDDATRATFAKNQEYIVDAASASKVIRGFKAHLAQQKAPVKDPAPETGDEKDPPVKETPALDSRRKRQLKGSATPANKGRGPTLSGVPKDGDEDALWDAWEEHDRANGR